jgi:hypothetical protein
VFTEIDRRDPAKHGVANSRSLQRVACKRHVTPPRSQVISQKGQSTKSSASEDAPGALIMHENQPDCASQTGKAKSRKARAS